MSSISSQLTQHINIQSFEKNQPDQETHKSNYADDMQTNSCISKLSDRRSPKLFNNVQILERLFIFLDTKDIENTLSTSRSCAKTASNAYLAVYKKCLFQWSENLGISDRVGQAHSSHLYRLDVISKIDSNDFDKNDQNIRDSHDAKRQKIDDSADKSLMMYNQETKGPFLSIKGIDAYKVKNLRKIIDCFSSNGCPFYAYNLSTDKLLNKHAAQTISINEEKFFLENLIDKCLQNNDGTTITDLILSSSDEFNSGSIFSCKQYLSRQLDCSDCLQKYRSLSESSNFLKGLLFVLNYTRTNQIDYTILSGTNENDFTLARGHAALELLSNMLCTNLDRERLNYLAISLLSGNFDSFEEFTLKHPTISFSKEINQYIKDLTTRVGDDKAKEATYLVHSLSNVTVKILEEESGAHMVHALYQEIDDEPLDVPLFYPSPPENYWPYDLF